MILRPLTKNEIRLAKPLFGDAIDYAAVRISSGKSIFLQPPGYAMTVSNSIYMDNRYREDYSQEDSSLRALFIHEMTHIWQFQNKILNPLVEAMGLGLKHKFNYHAAYDFYLDKNKDLLHYGMEEQAEIIEGYFLARHESRAAQSPRCKNNCSAAEKLALYEKVLEKFLANPAYAKRDEFPRKFKGKPPQP